MANASDRIPLAARLLIAASVLWLVIAIVYFSDAACTLEEFIALASGGFLIAVLWIIQTAARPSLLQAPARKYWISVPLAGALGIVSLMTDWELALRVALCEGAVSEYVAEVPPGGLRVIAPTPVGLFRVEDAKEYDGGVYLFTSRSFLNRHGVAHIPPDSSPAPRIAVHHLYGQWYCFDWRF